MLRTGGIIIPIVLFIATSCYIADAVHPLAVIPGILLVTALAIYAVVKEKGKTK